MSCLACKNKSSIDRCESRALRNLPYCGKHMRCKKTNQWAEKNPRILSGILKIQSLVRGVLTRTPLRIAGVGVLKRSLCHNDDEIITMDPKTSVHPHDYFSIEEGGKVYWFDQRSIIQWSQKELEIKNPYTRTVLSREDTKRLRLVWNFRQKKGLQLYHEGQRQPMSAADRRDNRWLRVTQIMREHGYEEIHHENFISMNIPQFAVFINSLTEDTRWLYFENHDPNLHRFHSLLKNIRNAAYTYNCEIQLSSDVATLILSIMHEIRDLEDFVFLVYGAYHRANEFENSL